MVEQLPNNDTAPGGLPLGVDDGSADILWRTTPEYIGRSRLLAFMQAHGISEFSDLLARSVEDIEWFWDAVVRDLDLQFYRPYSEVLDLSGGIEWPTWFVGGQYNYVHDAVDKHAEARPGSTAIAWEGEDGSVRNLSYAELQREVNRAANALLSLGIGKGDRVGIFMPMLPETAVAVLAVSKIGAIYTPIFSGYGGVAVASRLNSCDAKLLITANGFYRAGKTVPMKAAADEAAALSPSVQHVLVVRRTGEDVQWQIGRDLWWDELVASSSPECATERTSASDPYMIIYTSGTTGRPKGIVHVHAGFPVKAAQELAHCFDLHKSDTLFWISDIGWMMGPWAIAGSLMLGATCLLYEGLISHPTPGRLWEIVERHKVTHLGISPTAVRSLMGHGEEWVRSHDVSSLWIMSGAGEPWTPEAWLWLFNEVGEKKRPLVNYSGGTEVSGGILSGNTLLPLKTSAFSGPVLGMAADVIDPAGNSIRGAVGELCIRKPWVGMASGFWNDPDRYLETYWSRVPGVWVHGDWARIDNEGFWYILGRSDDTIKLAGKRVGPAEVEAAAASHPGVAEAAAVGVPDPLKGEALALFVVLRDGYAESPALANEISEAVVAQLGKTLRPQALLFVPELPHTRNGKILRRLVRASYTGEPPGDLSALENPGSLAHIAAAGGNRPQH